MLEGVKRTCADQFKEAPIAKVLILTGIVLFIITAILGKVYAEKLGTAHEGYVLKYWDYIPNDWWNSKEVLSAAAQAKKYLTLTLIFGSVTAATLLTGLTMLAMQQKVQKEEKQRERGENMMIAGAVFIILAITAWTCFAIKYSNVASELKKAVTFEGYPGHNNMEGMARQVYLGSQIIYTVGLLGTITAGVGLPLFFFGLKGMYSKKSEESTGIEFDMRPIPDQVGSLNNQQFGEL